MTRLIVLVGHSDLAAVEPLETRLAQHDYRLEIVSDAAAALELAQSKQVSTFLVDIGTPELKGVETCRLLNQNMKKRVPIVAINQRNHILRAQALRQGADVVIDEPLAWTELHHLLESPITQDKHPTAAGPLLGQTLEDLDGTASLLSHDLKSPISVIISSLEVLLTFQDEDSLSDPSQRLLRGALHAAYRQLNLVNTLVDLPRLELGSYDLQLSEVDLAHLLRSALEREAYTLEIKGLNVETMITNQPVRVMADRDLIQEVISTLIDCIMKFTVRDDTMWIKLDLRDGEAVLQFSDTGRPITRGFEADIMRRAPQWTHRQAGARTSVALGLPFVYQVAQVHKGTFTAQSAENGKCTSFTFSISALP